MKKILSTLCMILLFLTGCADSRSADLPSVPADTPQQTSGDTTIGRQALDDSGTLWYIPCEAVESSIEPKLDAFGGSLLVSSMRRIDCENKELILKLVDPETGLMQQGPTIIQSFAEIFPQIIGESILVSDSFNGMIRTLDGSLEITEELRTEIQDRAAWYLSGDQSTVYRISIDGALTGMGLSSRAEAPVIDNAAGFSLVNEEMDCITLAYTDSSGQEKRFACLDLADGTVENLPFTGQFSFASHSGDVWLARPQDKADACLVGTDASPSSFSKENCTFFLLAPQNHLLAVSSDRSMLYLYTADGEFLSRCTLPGAATNYFEGSMVWSDLQGGYFFPVKNQGGATQLLFWDISTGVRGDDL